MNNCCMEQIWQKNGKQIYNEREDLKNILSCVDFTRVYNVIKKLPELNHIIIK